MNKVIPHWGTHQVGGPASSARRSLQGGFAMWAGTVCHTIINLNYEPKLHP